jgi:AcrR family transcriptional regulator
MDKRQAILAGALRLFASDGYARASIDAIAAEAGVSTRTIYNYFGDKTRLFVAVIQDSAAAAADAQIAVIDRHLRKIVDLEADLVAFGLDLVAPMPDHADHFALVRQVQAERTHVPRAAIRSWRENGPLRVRRELGRRLERIAGDGMLRIDHPERCALHLMLLVGAAEYAYAERITGPERRAWVAAGVHAFLRGYGPL